MSASTIPTPQFTPSAKFENAAEWWHALGDVPLERIVMDPPPGTATEDDLVAFVDGDDKRLVELVNGTLVEKTVGWFESLIAMRLGALLTQFVNARKLGVVVGADATLRMKSRNVRLPDVSFISFDDMPGRKLPPNDEAVVSLPPTLAVEVLSKGNTKREMELKLKEYFASGTRLAWLIDPKKKTVSVYESPTKEPARVLTEHEALDGGRALPGFSTPIADLLSKS